MRRRIITEIPNLKDLTCTAAKRIAREMCPKTDRILSEETRIPRSTIAGFFKRSDYHPSIETIPDLCFALGNFILLQWPVAQVGGYVVFPPSAHSKVSLQHYIAGMTKEFSDVLEQDARAKMKDSPGGERYTDNERSVLLRELNHLEEKIEAAKMMLMEKRKAR